MFSKRHYEAIARVISTAYLAQGARENIARAMADAFAKDNPAFNRSRFLAACDVQ